MGTNTTNKHKQWSHHPPDHTKRDARQDVLLYRTRGEDLFGRFSERDHELSPDIDWRVTREWVPAAEAFYFRQGSTNLALCSPKTVKCVGTRGARTGPGIPGMKEGKLEVLVCFGSGKGREREILPL